MTDFDMTVLDPHAQAKALAEALMARKLTVVIYDTRAHRLYPCLMVFSEASECSAYVYTATDKAAIWRFWFASTMEPIALASEVSIAADKIAATLAPPKVRLIPVRPI